MQIGVKMPNSAMNNDIPGNLSCNVFSCSLEKVYCFPLLEVGTLTSLTE